MVNESEFILISSDYQYYMSVAVHDHILNSILTVFVLAFIVGHGFGMFNRELLELVKARLKGQK